MTNYSASLFKGQNAAFLDQLYEQYLADPASVSADWQATFREIEQDVQQGRNEAFNGPSWGRKFGAARPDLDIPQVEVAGEVVATKAAPAPVAKPANDAPATTGDQTATRNSIRALMLIRAYRVRGHLEADLDPLKLTVKEPHPELDYRTYGFTDSDLDTPIFIDHVLGLDNPTLRQIVDTLKTTYAKNIGVEFMHIADPEAKSWLQRTIEGTRYETVLGDDEKEQILDELTRAETFETFLHRKYVGTKRFGLDGGESLVPAIEECIRTAANDGVQEIVFGMAHRGRLNVLTNIMGKPFKAVFSEFQGTPANPDDVQGSGDVKYHLGTSTDRDINGKKVHMSLTANPSHLEAVNPLVVGKVRAKQAQLKDTVERTSAMAILLHGDAAFAGQGVVPETLAMSELQGYRTGGTIHFVINNQIGFTTNPASARSSPYCTDVARMVQSPIFHVNADDPEAVVWVTRVATEYRQKFHKDVVLDIICYRRHGHNEGDEPAFTQPLMYQEIAKHPTTRTLYAKQLEAGFLAAGGGDDKVKKFQEQLEQDFKAAEAYQPSRADWLEGAWQGFEKANQNTDSAERKGKTEVPLATLKDVGQGISKVPEGVNIHSKIVRQLKAKQKMIETGEGIDWATAEALAFGTLLAEGHGVRFSGQDVRRGTFSQRHAVLSDQETGADYTPLNTLKSNKGDAHLEIINSHLSEFGVLGFEYGYSLAEPNTLTLWEAQFGDFSNGAQIIFDQFISSAEAKWLRMSGITVLLPHGYEGQGPEHSSARLERYLQLCAEDNMQVANCSTPAQYFHILRRQLRRNFRKPLIMMTPKSLLRHKECVSKLSELAEGTGFHRVLPEADTSLKDNDITRVVFCSGKVYYDLLKARREANLKNVALVRLEQFYPFPENSVIAQLKRYPKATVIWCQEEPQNQGAWHFVDRRLEAAIDKAKIEASRPIYAGRPEAASPATGLMFVHLEQQEQLIAEALGTTT